MNTYNFSAENLSNNLRRICMRKWDEMRILAEMIYENINFIKYNLFGKSYKEVK